MAGGSTDGRGPVKTLVPLAQAARHVGKDERTVQRWVASGRVTAYPDGTGRRLVVLQEVIAVEADIRTRTKNRQMQKLSELFAPEGPTTD